MSNNLASQRPIDDLQKMQQKVQQEKPKEEGLWIESKDNKGQTSFQVNQEAMSANADVTSISLHKDEVRAPDKCEWKALGYKIDMEAKKPGLIDDFKKEYLGSKSNNLLLARFSGFKASCMGAVLSKIGLSPKEIDDLKQEAIEEGVSEIEHTFAENEYNSELLEIVGSGRAKTKREQQSIVGEIRNQLMARMTALGKDGYYTEEKVIEIQLNQCHEILSRFKEEEQNIKYELAFLGHDTEDMIKNG
ncbi:MAG: hypothetical protein ABIH39_03725 [Candidatus Margulisiibacteriota bacterium]